jgi:hypothetical protein
LAEDPQTTLYEVEALFGSPLNPIANPSNAFICLPVEVYLTDVADLADPVQAHALGTNAQELTGDWRSFAHRAMPAGGKTTPHAGLSPTQLLGAELFAGGFKGLISFSAKCPARKVLAVFPESLAVPCYIQYTYEDHQGKHQIIKVP